MALFLVKKRLNSLSSVSVNGFNLRFKVAKRDKRQDGVANLGILVFIDAPEAFWTQSTYTILSSDSRARQIALGQHVPYVVIVKAEGIGDQHIEDHAYPQAFVWGQCVSDGRLGR